MVVSSRHRNGRSATAEVDGGVARVCSTEAQLSEIVPPPTLQVAVVKDGTGVLISSRHRDRGAATAEVDGVG